MEMIINTKNQKLSRNRKRRIERKSKLDDNMKLLLNKSKTEKKKKNLDKVKELEILLVRIKCANKPNKLQSALKELNTKHVVNKNLHEIKHEILQEYTGEFEMVGYLKIGDQNTETHARFINISNYEAYINTIDQNYDSEDAIFNGYIYKIDIPQFNLVNRSQYGNGCDFKHEIIEYRGNNCYILFC